MGVGGYTMILFLFCFGSTVFKTQGFVQSALFA
jgi:hypothetical protein